MPAYPLPTPYSCLPLLMPALPHCLPCRRYSASVLKPWYPAFDDSTLRSIFAATCLTTAAQEVLLRGYVAAVLGLWWASVFNDARGPEDALFWVSGCERPRHRTRARTRTGGLLTVGNQPASLPSRGGGLPACQPFSLQRS